MNSSALTPLNRVQLESIIRSQSSEPFTDNEVPRLLDFKNHVTTTSQEVTTITGVRRCGKSKFLRQIIGVYPQNTAVLNISFDDPRLAKFRAEDFELLFEVWLEMRQKGSQSKHDGLNLLLFDEVQLIEGWERWIEHFSKMPKTKVFVTGSNAKLLSSELATLLTGRHLELHLTPLSFRELCSHRLSIEKSDDVISAEDRAGIAGLFKEFFEYGGFPRAILSKDLFLLSQYHSDIIERDILKRLRRANSDYIYGLAQILANESSRLFNRSNVARVLGLKDQVTVGKYCEAFKATYLYTEIRGFSRSVRKKLRSLSKFYAVDHALAREVSAQVSSGALLENLVYMEILRDKKSISYWHSGEGFEVDFIVSHRGKLELAIQVAENLQSPETREREIRALIAAKKELGISELFIVTAYEDEYIESEKIRIIPFWKMALTQPWG